LHTVLFLLQVTTGEDVLLNEITDELITDTEKVKAMNDDDTKKIFKAVADNLNILKWLKENLDGMTLFKGLTVFLTCVGLKS